MGVPVETRKVFFTARSYASPQEYGDSQLLWILWTRGSVEAFFDGVSPCEMCMGLREGRNNQAFVWNYVRTKGLSMVSSSERNIIERSLHLSGCLLMGYLVNKKENSARRTFSKSTVDIHIFITRFVADLEAARPTPKRSRLCNEGNKLQGDRSLL